MNKTKPKLVFDCKPSKECVKLRDKIMMEAMTQLKNIRCPHCGCPETAVLVRHWEIKRHAGFCYHCGKEFYFE